MFIYDLNSVRYNFFLNFRIILVQNAPEKVLPPPSPTLAVQIKPTSTHGERCSQVVANIESSPRETLHSSGHTSVPYGEQSIVPTDVTQIRPIASVVELQALETNKDNGFNRMETPSYDQFSNSGDPRCSDKFLRIDTPSFDPLELNIQEMLALDIENSIRRSKSNKDSVISLGSTTQEAKTGINRNKTVFKSLPNLSSSSENLLP